MGLIDAMVYKLWSWMNTHAIAYATHIADASAHHVKYTDAEVDAIVATHTAIGAAHHSKYTDAEVDAIVATHTAISTAHHTKPTGNGFRAHQSTAQSIPAYAFTVVVCEIEDYDGANAYNTTTGKFTPQTAGYYIIQGNGILSALADGVQFMTTIAKNGTNIVLDRGCTGALALAGGCVSTVIYMNGSTDYLELKVYHKSAGNILLNTNSGYVVFSGWLMLPT